MYHVYLAVVMAELGANAPTACAPILSPAACFGVFACTTTWSMS